MSKYEIMELSQGNTYNITYIVTQLGSLVPKNLADTAQLKFALAKNTNSVKLLEKEYGLSPDLTIDSPSSSGAITIVLTAAELNAIPEGRYYFEIWHKNAAGETTTLVSQLINLESKLIKA
jgi:hypothetical protein